MIDQIGGLIPVAAMSLAVYKILRIEGGFTAGQAASLGVLVPVLSYLLGVSA